MVHRRSPSSGGSRSVWSVWCTQYIFHFIHFRTLKSCCSLWKMVPTLKSSKKKKRKEKRWLGTTQTSSPRSNVKTTPTTREKKWSKWNIIVLYMWLECLENFKKNPYCGVTQAQQNALTEIGEMKRPLCEYVSKHRRANSSRQTIAVYLHVEDETHSFKDNKHCIHGGYSVPKRSRRGHLCKSGTYHAWTKGEELIHHLLSQYNGIIQLSTPIYTSRPWMSCGLTKCHDISGVNDTWWNFPAFSMTDEAQVEKGLWDYTLHIQTLWIIALIVFFYPLSTGKMSLRKKYYFLSLYTLYLTQSVSRFVCLCVPSSSSLTLMSLCPVLSPISSFLFLHPDHTHILRLHTPLLSLTKAVSSESAMYSILSLSCFSCPSSE